VAAAVAAGFGIVAIMAAMFSVMPTPAQAAEKGNAEKKGWLDQALGWAKSIF